MDQQAIMELLQRVAGDFSILRLILAGFLGLLLGGLVGVLLSVLLARAGWLARRQRWHHLLLKLYFLLLPGCGALIGMQAGVYFNAERQVVERIEDARADVQLAADKVRLSFDRYLAEAGLPDGVNSQQSVQGILDLMVEDYLKRNPISLPELEGEGLLERVAVKGFEMFRSSVLRRALTDAAIEKAVETTAGYTGVVSEQVARELISTRLAEIFSADFVLKVAKRQVSSQMVGFHLTVALQVLLLLGLVLGECLLARWLGWMPQRAAQPVEAVLSAS